MDYNYICNIKNKDDFLGFMREYLINETNAIDINDYFESIISWVEDMDGFFSNTGRKPPDIINWSFIATLLYVGKIYE